MKNNNLKKNNLSLKILNSHLKKYFSLFLEPNIDSSKKLPVVYFVTLCHTLKYIILASFPLSKIKSIKYKGSLEKINFCVKNIKKSRNSFK